MPSAAQAKKAENYFQKGRALFAAGEPKQAMDAYRRALGYASHPDILIALANCHYALGNREGAKTYYERALIAAPRNTHALFNLAQMQTVALDDDITAQLRAVRENAAVPPAERARACFALGKIYEDSGDVGNAFAYYAEANRLQAALLRYDMTADLAFIDAIEQVFDAPLFASLQNVGCADATPIFIVGMPRSGSTLVEQILASHPEVHGLGESDVLPVLPMQRIPRLTGAPFPRGLERLRPEHYAALGAAYVAEIRRRAPQGTPHIADKTLNNYLYIGLIRLLLPQAKIIHCVREPMDACWSMFRHHFAGKHYYCYDQETLGRFYVRYARLMQYWHRVLPGAVYDIHYEALVENPGEETRKLIAHCGLAWNERCLAFHETKRAVSTASALQVRQPIYKDAVLSWQPVAEALAPLKAALQN